MKLDQGVHYVPQNGTSLRDSIHRAIQIAKALKAANLHAYVHLNYNRFTAGVNEYSDIDNSVKELREKIEEWMKKFRN